MAQPIWRDYEVVLGTDSMIDFRILAGTEVIYTGKAVKRPGAASNTIRINDICSDYLSSLETMTDDELEGMALPVDFTVQVPDPSPPPGGSPWKAAGSVVFTDDWSYDHSEAQSPLVMSDPILGWAAEGQPIPLTLSDNTGVSFTVTDSEGQETAFTPEALLPARGQGTFNFAAPATLDPSYPEGKTGLSDETFSDGTAELTVSAGNIMLYLPSETYELTIQPGATLTVASQGYISRILFTFEPSMNPGLTAPSGSYDEFASSAIWTAGDERISSVVFTAGASGAVLSVTVEPYVYSDLAKALGTAGAGSFLLSGLPEGTVKATAKAQDGQTLMSWEVRPAMTGESCYRYVLFYRNARGGWDAMPMLGRESMQDTLTRHDSEREYDNAVQGSRGTYCYAVEIERTWTLRTGWLTDAQSLKMHNLLNSPEAWLYDMEQGLFLPVVLTGTTTDYRTYRGEGASLVRYDITATLAQQRTRR